MLFWIEQVGHLANLHHQAHPNEIGQGGFLQRVKEILERAGRGEDYIETASARQLRRVQEILANEVSHET